MSVHFKPESLHALWVFIFPLAAILFNTADKKSPTWEQNLNICSCQGEKHGGDHFIGGQKIGGVLDDRERKSGAVEAGREDLGQGVPEVGDDLDHVHCRLHKLLQHKLLHQVRTEGPADEKGVKKLAARSSRLGVCFHQADNKTLHDLSNSGEMAGLADKEGGLFQGSQLHLLQD